MELGLGGGVDKKNVRDTSIETFWSHSYGNRWGGGIMYGIFLFMTKTENLHDY